MDKLFERKMIINKILIPKYSNLEEIINSVSHGIGSILSIYGLVLLKNTKSIEALVFGITLFLLYTIFLMLFSQLHTVKLTFIYQLHNNCLTLFFRFVVVGLTLNHQLYKYLHI